MNGLQTIGGRGMIVIPIATNRVAEITVEQLGKILARELGVPEIRSLKFQGLVMSPLFIVEARWSDECEERSI